MRLLIRGKGGGQERNVCECVVVCVGGDEERRRVNIMYVSVVCVEDVKD